MIVSNIYYNNNRLPIKSFDKYIDLYLDGNVKIYESASKYYKYPIK